ncbi:MAG: 4-alpha-glucanotransferase [Actinophytocola sp.]|uniref:4-alpha-glucanotransferase n=1 Tax=Actinophytocola sp. TaxID=1872138 RepID=UPI001327FD85|nr:4-alpha-glucanotransferase [Actinophytocola sp.]MPZ79843.1 4-alpha-glucanotransferase [Actinophytocola sp.]
MDAELRALAGAHGVATWYEDTERRRIEVADDTVVAVLAQLGVDATTPATVHAELTDAIARHGRTTVPDPMVLRAGEAPVLGVPGELTLEDGTVRPVPDRLPPDLPLGWHTLTVGERQVTVAVTPPKLPPVPPAWGWMVQAYALHSPGSWGIGDLTDLRTLVTGSAKLGAGVLLVNPVQAITPVPPIQRSPYSPSSRRFANPLYLRITDTEPFRRASPEVRAEVVALAPPPGGGLIDYDAVWAAKLAALELLWRRSLPLPPPPDDPALCDFATFCALAERHGPDWRRWPAELRHPRSTAVEAARRDNPRTAFHAWLQGLCREQLTEVRTAAEGMAVGIVHDLPVGVDPAGADAWALQDVLASEVTVGAPPDAFSQQGQDWNLPPWRPDRLAAAGYAPFRDVIRAVLAHADGIRVDHVMGLWRLWWIPPGRPASGGTYVTYDAKALLGVLALEAHRASAIVVGEDLGTVSDEVRGALRDRGVLSSAVLWFQRDEDAPGEPLLAPSRWPADAMASISTHDLPTAAGFLRGEHVRVRAERGLLADPEAEKARAAADRDELLAELAAHGLLPAGENGAVGETDLVAALHALLATSASRLLLTSPQDALGEVHQPNLPGTIDEYPNWRIPLPVSVDELLTHPVVVRAVAFLRAARSGTEPKTRSVGPAVEPLKRR